MKPFILTLLSLGLVTPAIASEHSVGSHLPLAAAVNSVSSLQVNTLRCFQGDMHGYFGLATGDVVICQDNATKIGVMSDWTLNDLYTLRHEAHHLLQDCMSGGVGDLQSRLFFDNLTPSLEALGPERVSGIRVTYAGAPKHTVEMEIEAFAVATYVSPETIATSITKYCL